MEEGVRCSCLDAAAAHLELGRPHMNREERGQPCQVGGGGGPGEADVRPIWFLDAGRQGSH